LFFKKKNVSKNKSCYSATLRKCKGIQMHFLFLFILHFCTKQTTLSTPGNTAP
jgi:hypothetical protein